jgi:ligand-binding sensor domain-containing protein/serine phosphatase RsbU (regulator of sigma subunit)
MLRLIFLLFIFTNLPYSHGQQFHFKNYSLEEGLSRSGVYYILQDHSGFLWVGTDGGGVCKFNGVSFTNYTRQHGLASEKVRVIFEDSNNILWFGTDNGLSFFNGKGFTTLTTKDGISDNFIRSITQDFEGNIWVGTNRGISIIDPSEKRVSDKLKINFNLPHRKIRSLLADKKNKIVWIGTDAGLCKWEDSKITIFDENDGLPHNLILNLFLDKQNNLWVGTQNGVSKIRDGEITSWTTKDGLINDRVRSINQDVRGNIWIGTKTGISVFDGTYFLNLTITNGLSNERIRCVQTDNFDNIWLGTYFGGIMRFNYKDFIAYTPKDGLISNQILTIIEDEKGDIIIGSFDGVTKLKIEHDKLQSIKYVTTENGLLSNSVNAILKDHNGFYWYGTEKGISILKDDTLIEITEVEGLKETEITVIKYYNDTYYIGTVNGLAEIKIADDYTIIDLKFSSIHDGLAGREISFIEQDSIGQIWFGFADGQISILSQNQINNPILPANIHEITAMTFDLFGRVWLGTNGRGLYYGQYDSENKKLNLNNLSTSNKLSSNYIFSLLYQNNNIWVGNEKGLDLIDFETDSSFIVQTFGPERGFLGLQNNRNASFIDKNGNLWFGTVNGLYSLKNKEIELFKSGKKSINYIQAITVNKEKKDWHKSKYANGTEGIYNLPIDLKLPYNQNNISFDFIALNYIAPEKLKYAWKLEGFDDKWSSPTSKNYYSYTNLDPGKYSFQLKSTNETGILLDEITKFNFEINNPFWSTWWFRIIAIFLTLGLVLLFMNLRTRQLKGNQKALEEIIAKRTEEITKQKNEIESTKHEIEEQNEQLQEKNKEITDSILYSRRIQRSILPSLEKTNNLLKDYFIFYKPKDIVSGDFYWIEQSVKNNSKIFFAVADCTGHGVPGAMVSLISTRALNSSLLEQNLEHPNDILDNTTDIVTEAFTDYETGTIIKDGMDIALGSLNYINDTEIEFEFSGAQNPAWIIRQTSEDNLIVNGEELIPNISTETHKLFVIKATKQPIGHFDNKVPFVNNICNLTKGNKIYFFSDGFADQFGGESSSTAKMGGKKYKYKPFKNFLLGIQHHTISRQKIDLENEFYTWKRDFEQVDDICIMGVSV